MRACVRARACASTRARFLTHCPANSGRRVRELVRLLGAGWGGARVVRALADSVPACECRRAPAQSPQYSAAAFWQRAERRWQCTDLSAGGGACRDSGGESGRGDMCDLT